MKISVILESETAGEVKFSRPPIFSDFPQWPEPGQPSPLSPMRGVKSWMK